MVKLAVFASGTGSNFDAITNAISSGYIHAEVALLVCDKKNAPVVSKAQNKNIPAFVFSPKEYPNKAAYEQDILHQLSKYNISIIVLAGYMRLIGTTILHQYHESIINIHPSLLPSFPGLDAVGQAMNAGVKVTGVTIHYVDQGMDTGKIIAQEALDISSLHTRNEIETQIHQIEHVLYPKIIKQLVEEKR